MMGMAIYRMVREYGLGLSTVKVSCWLRSLSTISVDNSETVISIQEDPYPLRSYDDLSTDERWTLTEIRRNFTNVFRQLSKAHDSSRDDPLMQLPIRKRIGNSEEETIHRPTDAPGLLFYCLFDDWRTGYSLVVQREHYYAAELNQLVSPTL